MGKFTHQAFRRLLLATNILTITVLIIVLVKEKYPLRIYRKLFSAQTQRKAYSYLNNFRYTNYTIVYPLYKKQKNIIMLGNSLTNYANWNELLNRTDVANRGIGGDITAGFIERLNYILSIKPKICFIEGGVNDLYRGISQDTIIRNLTLIVDTLQAHNIKPVLTTVTLLAAQYKSENLLEENKKIKELNARIFLLVKSKNIKLIDLNAYISDGNFLISEYAVQDGIHFTAKAYLIWKQEIEKILNQYNI